MLTRRWMRGAVLPVLVGVLLAAGTSGCADRRSLDQTEQAESSSRAESTDQADPTSRPADSGVSSQPDQGDRAADDAQSVESVLRAADEVLRRAESVMAED
jgi:hypothetical protein